MALPHCAGAHKGAPFAFSIGFVKSVERQAFLWIYNLFLIGFV